MPDAFFFVAEADDFEVKRQRDLSRVEEFGDGEADEDTERAIVLAGIGHRVEMRTDDQRRCLLRRALAAAPEIVRGVDSDIEAGRSHPRPHQRVGPRHRRRPEGADEAMRFVADRAQ